MRHCVTILFILIPAFLCAQSDSSNKPKKYRKPLVWGITTIAPIAVHTALYHTWYANYPRSKFHWINDNNEWLHMDKAGHLFSAYTIQRNVNDAFTWSGYGQQKSAILGAIYSIAFQFPIEYFDGKSAAWGASKADLIANTVGTFWGGLQNFFWGEVRIPIRFSFRGTPLARLRPGTLGSNAVERMLKDYNGQIYWVDINPELAKIRPSFWPKWLGLSIGYGANGMLGGYRNTWTDKDGIVQNYEHITRYRQYFISPSINLQYLHSQKTWVQFLVFVTNHVRIPTPTAELNKIEKFRFHWIYW